MLKNGKSDNGMSLCYNGCSCHNSKKLRRKAKKAMKQKENQKVRKEIKDETS